MKVSLKGPINDKSIADLAKIFVFSWLYENC